MDHFRTIADAAAALIWTGDADGTCGYVNQAWLDFTGRAVADELGAGWTDQIHPYDRQEVLATLAEAQSSHSTIELEFRLRRRDGQDRWLLGTWRARYDRDDHFVGYVGSCVDISDRKQVQFELEALLAESGHAQAQLAAQAQRLHHLADSDPLTGLLNRRSFREQFKREWGRAQRYDRAIACVMLDIDFFKRVNDAHGHAAGDAVLRRVAELLVSQCRPSDRVCRYGGEEFCIMVTETNEQGAAVLAERLRATLATTPLEIGGKPLEITSSFGVAERLGDVDDLEELIDRADRALYTAKHSGRNRVIRFSSQLDLPELAGEDSPLRILARYTAGDLAVPIRWSSCDASIRFAAETLLKAGRRICPGGRWRRPPGRLRLRARPDGLGRLRSRMVAKRRRGDEVQRRLLRARHARPADLPASVPGNHPPGRGRQERPPARRDHPRQPAALLPRARCHAAALLKAAKRTSHRRG